MSVLEIQNVTKRFGSLVAVRDVSLNVAKGELCAIIGPNGAGKTTFFNLISGFFPPTAGAISFDGRDITKLATRSARRARHGAHVPDHRDLSGTHRVRERPHRRRGRPAAIACGRGSTAPRRRESTRGSRRRSSWSSLETKTDRLVGELVPWRSARRRDRDGAGVASRSCCCSTSPPPAWATRRPTRSPS